MTRRRRLMGIAAALIALVASLTLGLTLLSWRRPQPGPLDGRLRSCPDSPNCVCSQDTDDEHTIEPFDAGDNPAAMMDRIRSVLNDHPHAQIVSDTGGYLHAEFTTPVLRFVDDVEFLLDESAGVIHVRSASRVGYSDLGANRMRVERIRKELVQSSE